MTDKRWSQLANILVTHSTQVAPGEKVQIAMVEVETLPLVHAVYTEAIKAGALPQVQFLSAYLERALMLYGNSDQLEWVPDQEAHSMEWADVYIGLRGARNPYEFADVTSESLVAHKRAMGKVSAMRNQTRWVLVRVPNESLAQQAQMSLDDMMEFFFNATLQDWREQARRYEELKAVFDAATTVRLTGRDTDLCLSTAGRTYCVGDGTHNMPDGEIFTCPVDDSAEGHIHFEFPGIYAGVLVRGIRLELSEGKVVRATAEENEDLLHKILETDDGAQRLGEFGVGTNFNIDRFCYDILYDEKIGGTIHLALGRAFAECGGVNHSALHWDIIKDLRQEGAIYLDGRKVLENGKFLI
jgi:aminopeptidase